MIFNRKPPALRFTGGFIWVILKTFLKIHIMTKMRLTQKIILSANYKLQMIRLSAPVQTFVTVLQI